MLKRLYEWTLALAAHRRAGRLLAAIAFLEASVFPIPADVLLIPMVLADKRAAWRLAAVCTAASALGGLVGYGIGYLLFETLGRPILDFYGYAGQFAAAEAIYREWGVWIVAAGALTPLPYKVVTITSGVVRLDLAVFMLVSIGFRALRYFAVTALLWRFGPPVRGLVERNLGLATAVFFVLLLAGFVVLRYVL